MKRTILIALAATATALVASPVLAADSSNGEDLFDTNCGDCHSVSPKGLNRKGPTLYHVVGRRAGSVPGFRYSADMLARGKANLAWSPKEIDTYLANPKAVVPAGIMKFKGLASATDRADLIAYLASLR